MSGIQRQPIAHIVVTAIPLIAIALILLATPPTARALPEYADPDRTGEPCATCHVSAGGGGPRTLRGMLWTNAGRPNEVPILEGILLAPGVKDAQVLYETACSGCHGTQGEGLSATSLVEIGYSPGIFRRLIVNGRPRRGMPAFAEQLTEEQLDLLVNYVVGLNAGAIIPVDRVPLPLPALLSSQSGDVSPIIYRGN